MNQACLRILTLVGWGAQTGLVLFCRYRNVPIGDFSFGNKSYFCKSTRDTLSCGFFVTGFGESPSFPAILFYTDAQAIACHMHGVVEVVTAGIEFRKVRTNFPPSGIKAIRYFMIPQCWRGGVAPPMRLSGYSQHDPPWVLGQRILPASQVTAVVSGSPG